MKSFYIFLLIPFMLLNLSPSFAQVKEYQLNESYQIDKEGTIHLNSDDADVTIRGSNRQEVHIKVKHRLKFEKKPNEYTFKMKIEERSGDIHIREEEKMNTGLFNSMSYEQLEYKILIDAPRSVSLNIQGDDDSYSVENIGGSIRLNADDIDATLRKTSGNKFNISMDDGSIQMEEGKGQMNLEMDDGSFTLSNGSFDRMEMKADDGSIEITNTLTSKGNYHVQMDDGRLNFNITGGGGRFIIHHDDAAIRAHGGFEFLEEQEDQSEYRLDGGHSNVEIQTDDGHIDLKKL